MANTPKELRLKRSQRATREEAQHYKRIRNVDILSVTAVAYLRTSTDDQELGIQAQRAAIEAWSLAQRVTISEWYIDQGVSGTTDPSKRPALSALLTQLNASPTDYVVVLKMDRLARDLAMSGFIEFAATRAGARVVTCEQVPSKDVSPDERLMRGVLASMAEYERALISFRTKSALAAAKRNGVVLGRRRRLSYKTNCVIFHAVQLLHRHGHSAEWISGYLASHCTTQLSASTVARYVAETEVPSYLCAGTVAKWLRPWYRSRASGRTLVSHST